MMASSSLSPLHRFRTEASRCTACFEQGLLHQHDDGRRGLPLFHAAASCPSGVVLVAEAPNFADTYDTNKGRITVDEETDPTGRFMRELLGSVGLAPEDVLVTNTVLCLPARKNGKFRVTSRMIANCSPWLERVIVAADAKVVVTWGGVALAALKRVEPHSLILREAVGKLNPWFGRQLLPLYHPGRLARLTRSEEQQRADILCLADLLGGWRAATTAPVLTRQKGYPQKESDEA